MGEKTVVVTFKCRICGAAGQAATEEEAAQRKADHLASHRASGWVEPEEIIQRAIEQWAVLAFAPVPEDYPTLAHYIATTLEQEF